MLEAQVKVPANVAKKGGYKGGLKGTRHTVHSAAEARRVAGSVLGGKVFSYLNQPAGLVLPTHYVTLSPVVKSSTASDIDVLIRPDRSCEGPSILARRRPTSADRTEIPSLPLALATTPDEVVFQPVSFREGLGTAQALDIAGKVGLNVESEGAQRLAEALKTLYDDVFRKRDATSVDVTFRSDGDDLAVTAASLSFDPFALHRHNDVEKLRDRAQEHPSELEAEIEGMFYIKAPGDADSPPGNIGCFGYGAGLAMATMDALISRGGKPANFLDGGGGANADNARIGINICLRDQEVKVLFVNIFGGLTRCSLVAQGLMSAVRYRIRERMKVRPIVVRLRGTEADEANEALRESGLPFEVEPDFALAAQKAVYLAESAK